MGKKRKIMTIALASVLVLAFIIAVPVNCQMAEANDTVSIWVISKDTGKYNGESNKDGASTFTYDKNGFLTEMYTPLEPDVDYKEAYIKYVIKYNDDYTIKSQKRITKQVSKIEHKQTYKYKNGVLTSIKLDCDHYHVHGKKVFSYDDDGRISGVRFYYTYWGDGVVSGWDYTYYSDGNVKTATYLSSSEKKEYTNKFKYDSHGNISKVIRDYAGSDDLSVDGIENTYKDDRLVSIRQAGSGMSPEGELAVFEYKEIKVPKKYAEAVREQQKKLRHNAANLWTHDAHDAEGYGINMDFHMRW